MVSSVEANLIAVVMIKKSVSYMQKHTADEREGGEKMPSLYNVARKILV